MNVIFLGNGPFAVPALKRLAASGNAIPLVVTRPDRPQGKHQQTLPGPVKTAANELGLTTAQPESVNDPEFIRTLQGLKADLLVVADFGQILSSDCLAATRLGGINIHGSLLPKYRGAAPIVWAIFHGDSVTGVSIIQMTSGLDAGGVIVRRELLIGPDETAADIEPTLAELGADAALEAIQLLNEGKSHVIPQDAALVTKAPRVRKEDGLIQWERSAQQIHNQVRAMQPWPIAYTFWLRSAGEPLRLQVLRTRIDSASAAAEPGTITSLERDRISVATGNGTLAILQLKPAGKGAQDAGTFLRGNRMAVGQKLGN